VIGDLEEAHWRALLVEIDGGVLLEDAAGRVRLMNRQFIDLFHLPARATEQELLSSDVFADVATSTFLDPDGFLAGISELRQRRVEIRQEPFTTVDQRSLERDVVPIHHGGEFIGLLWIVREVVSAERLEALAAQKDFYDRILEALPAQLAVFSPTGTYEYVSPSAISDPVVRCCTATAAVTQHIGTQRLAGGAPPSRPVRVALPVARRPHRSEGAALQLSPHV
jgi:PAS domain-containing protein